MEIWQAIGISLGLCLGATGVVVVVAVVFWILGRIQRYRYWKQRSREQEERTQAYLDSIAACRPGEKNG